MIGSSQSAESSGSEDQIKVREFCANGACVKADEIEAKLDEGNIQAAESSLREGLSLSLEEARSLLGRLEYQRGNVEGALRVFDGIDLQAASERLQSSIAGKNAHKNQSPGGGSQHSASLVLEAIYLKAKSLQKLGRSYDAAKECKSVLDAVEKIFQQGISDVQVDTRLQETVSQAVELLPELWKQAGYYPEAISAYRRALLSQWSLENDCCARIQKAFAVFLLHSGVEAAPPSLASQVEGSYVPKHNLEEAVLLLLILVRKCCLGKTKWDPSVMEHLYFALSMCSQTGVLGKELEETMPGVLHRTDRWNTLAFCYSGAGQHKAALNLLRKSLHRHERPDDLKALLLAAKICTEDSYLAAEGVEYAKRALTKAQESDEHLKSVAVHMLGLCLAKQAKLCSSDFERTRLQSEALKSLEAALALDPSNLDIVFGLSVQYAEQRNLSVALRYAKQYIDATGGSMLKGWRLLVLILSAQQRFSEASVITDAALDETVSACVDPSSEESFRRHHKRVAGAMHAARGEFQDAFCSYICGHMMEPNHVPGIILVASLISKNRSEAALPVARSILSDALKLEPANRKAWYHLGTVHRDDGRTADAADCFQAASMLEESDPIESFSSVY